jgi:hypothetical protein
VAVARGVVVAGRSALVALAVGVVVATPSALPALALAVGLPAGVVGIGWPVPVAVGFAIGPVGEGVGVALAGVVGRALGDALAAGIGARPLRTGDGTGLGRALVPPPAGPTGVMVG